MSDDVVSSSHLLNAYAKHSTPAFDMVVISARDESQKMAFNKQLQVMRDSDRHYLTAELNILVISDEQFADGSPDLKLGSGGSTLHIFHWLARKYGQNIFVEKKILLLHSGGYCQRLPHYSVCGKIFANLPIDVANSKLWSLLDLKLALLSPFAAKMKSGVWVTASDDIVTYSFKATAYESLPSFPDDSFVALGHPSGVDIAVNHGVYVLPDNELTHLNSTSLSMHSCVQVLQKPTAEQLFAHNAIVSKCVDKPFAITDSSYYIGPKIIVNKFLKYETKNLESEMDCYGDFFCPLGTKPITKDPNNPYYSPLTELLSGTAIQVLYLPHSKFYHLGTLSEYMNALADYSNKQLAISLCFKKIFNNHVRGTIICSLLKEGSKIDANSVLEFCDFSKVVVETNNNLLYNCIINEFDANENIIKFPPNHLFYSVPVNANNMKGWCTFCCSLNSKLKSKIWTDELYPVCKTSAQSLIYTIQLAQQSMKQDLYKDMFRLSMSQVVLYKDVDQIIREQTRLKKLKFNTTELHESKLYEEKLFIKIEV